MNESTTPSMPPPPPATDGTMLMLAQVQKNRADRRTAAYHAAMARNVRRLRAMIKASVASKTK